MTAQPTSLNTNLSALSKTLASAREIVFDFETSDVRPREAALVGLGVYVPAVDRAFYINIGSMDRNKQYPLYRPDELADVLRDFFLDPDRHAIAHNFSYDCRCIFKLGIDVACRTTCTLTNAHRVDENIRQFGKEPTYFRHGDASYGLKQLTAIFFNEQPPSLMETIGNTNTLFAPVSDVAKYCVLDVWNTWRLHQRTELEINRDYRLRKLVDRIDNPNQRLIAAMMWRGMFIGEAEARRQRDIYLDSIQKCRLAIWKTLQTRASLDTPRDALKVMRSLNLHEDLDYNPFFEPQEFDDLERERGPEPSVTRDILTEVFEDCTDKNNRKVIALFLSMWTMKQRISSFFTPLLAKVQHSHGELYFDRFSSTLATTRFSCSPNLQNLPGRADIMDADDPVRAVLPKGCGEHFATRNIFKARPGHYLVSMDLSAAEPRYLALLFQRALRHRDLLYRGEKSRLQELRRREQPQLLRAMYDLQDIGEDFVPEGIQWPSYHDDPLWEVFRQGDDPYNALLKSIDEVAYERAVKRGDDVAWLKANRWRGKKAFLALAYGSGAETLAPALKWSVQRTQRAIERLQADYATLQPLKELTRREMLHLGEVRSLWDRPRRINGFYQLTRPFPVTIEFYLMRPTKRTYQADIIPLGTTKWGIQAFVSECRILLKRSEHVVLAGNPDGSIRKIDNRDAFVKNIYKNHFNKPPFANFQYSNIRWVEDQQLLRRFLPKKVERGERQAFNALCQATGADHLRWLMNAMDGEVCQRQKFHDCHLVLTVHDSLVYEVPKGVWHEFVQAARPIMNRRPYWADIDIKVDVEVGIRFGRMRKV